MTAGCYWAPLWGLRRTGSVSMFTWFTLLWVWTRHFFNCWNRQLTPLCCSEVPISTSHIKAGGGWRWRVEELGFGHMQLPVCGRARTLCQTAVSPQRMSTPEITTMQPKNVRTSLIEAPLSHTAAVRVHTTCPAKQNTPHNPCWHVV